MSSAVKIVMVEDDHGHARLIEKNIRRANISNEIVHFDAGGAAIDYLFSDEVRANGPMLILLDLNLPDMSGTDILARVKGDDRLRRAPVVVLTTTDDPREIARCYDLGANVYVSKTMQYDKFVHAIQQLGMFVAVMKIPEVE